MPPSAALELLFGVLHVAKVGRGEGDSSHALKETSLLWVGLVPQQQFRSVAVLPTHRSHSRTAGPGLLPHLLGRILGEQLNLNLALLYVLHQPRQSALVFTAPLRICSGIQGRLPGLSRSLFLDMQGASEAHAGDVPLSPRSCLSKQETESSTDLGRVLGLMFVHVQILLQIVASLFYY